MTQKYKQFLGAFCVTVVLIGALCGFAVVDLSTERYMPGHFGPMFLITSIGGEGMEFTFLGEEYRFAPEPVEVDGTVGGLLRLFVPAPVQLARSLGEELYEMLPSGEHSEDPQE